MNYKNNTKNSAFSPDVIKSYNCAADY